MEALKNRLLKIEDSYDSFYKGVLEDCADYEGLSDFLMDYLNKNPNSNTSDVLEKIDYFIGIPYSDENGVWFQKDRVISEEEAERIANEEFNEV